MSPVYDSDLQAAVDATSVAKDTGETDLLAYLRQQLAEREVETADEDWLNRMIEGINGDPNYMIDSEPNDYDPQRDGQRDTRQ
jgi:hypothetical protein